MKQRDPTLPPGQVLTQKFPVLHVGGVPEIDPATYRLGVTGLVVFALEFPRPFAIPWRERVRKSLPAVFLILALMTAYPDIANIIYAVPAGIENRLLQLAFGATYALAIFVIFDSYKRIAHEERERLRWVSIYGNHEDAGGLVSVAERD